MTSSFSANLNLNYMATGDQSNAWGSVLNNQVFANIDQACGGAFSVSVAGSSDYTLSQANAQNFEHILTGAITGNINYIFPQINGAPPGRYISIYNNTSGNFTITVKQSGGTGIIVPQGQTRLLKLSASSTTALDAFTNLSSLNLGIPSSTFGTLGLYNGTNANLAALKAGNMGSSVTWTLPAGDGTNGQFLQTNGTAALSWATGTNATNSVTNAMLAQMAANTVKGNNTSGTANATDIALSAATLLGMGTSGNIAALTATSPLVIGASAITFNASQITNSLGGDVTVTTANTYYDGPSVAQGSSGTWFASGTVTVNDTSSSSIVYAKLWDGTTVIATARCDVSSANFPVSISLSGFLATPAGNLRISVTSNNRSGSTFVKSNFTGNSKDSTITAIRIG